MFLLGAKYSTDNAKGSAEVLIIPRRGSNVPRRCYTFHGQCQMFDGGAKYSTDGVKCSTEFLKYSVDDVKYSTAVLIIPRRGSNVPRRC